MPVKNEDWILDFSLSCASLWADHIIVADQNSTDRTPDICRSFEKVILINNNEVKLNMSFARQLLLDKAREFGTDNILFCLDADEVLSANNADDIIFQNTLNNLLPGQSIALEWLNLWGNLNTIRKDGIWGWSYKHFIFRDDGIGRFWTIATSEPRMPEIYMHNTVRVETVKNLHYQFVDRSRMLAKQRRYRIYDYLNAENRNFWKALKINLTYYPTKYLWLVKIFPILPLWVYPSEFLKKIRLDNASYWYNFDILNQIKIHGTTFFSYLDIWDTNWKELSGGTIEDPRNFLQKFYHKSQFFLYCINKIVPKFIKNNL